MWLSQLQIFRFLAIKMPEISECLYRIWRSINRRHSPVMLLKAKFCSLFCILRHRKTFCRVKWQSNYYTAATHCINLSLSDAQFCFSLMLMSYFGTKLQESRSAWSWQYARMSGKVLYIIWVGENGNSGWKGTEALQLGILIANQAVKINFWSVMWVDAVLTQWSQYHSIKTGSREHELKQWYLEQKDKLCGSILHNKGLQGAFGWGVLKQTYRAQPSCYPLNDGLTGKQDSWGI